MFKITEPITRQSRLLLNNDKIACIILRQIYAHTLAHFLSCTHTHTYVCKQAFFHSRTLQNETALLFNPTTIFHTNHAKHGKLALIFTLQIGKSTSRQGPDSYGICPCIRATDIWSKMEQRLVRAFNKNGNSHLPRKRMEFNASINASKGINRSKDTHVLNCDNDS